MMKKICLMAVIASLTMFCSCSNTKDKKANDDEDTEVVGKKKKVADNEETSSDDESSDASSTPEGLVKSIFKAARSEDYASVAGICAEGADKDSKMICNLEGDEKNRDSFKEYFSKGKVVGEPEISDNEAKVNIMFGPDGDKEETMNLVKEGKKWKLVSF